MDPFDAAWEVLAEQSKCDAPGSMEYQRVRAQWDRDGEMLAALMFIMAAANVSAAKLRDATRPITREAEYEVPDLSQEPDPPVP